MKDHPHYQQVDAVGHSRLATVYRARDLSLKREVAIKELNDEARRDERLLQRFWEEARFLANIEHDNVVQIYGLDQERGWVIMELASNGLDASIAQGPLPATVVRGVLRQVLDGLEFLHQQGHMHGAIKPANLLVTHQGTVKLSDTTGDAGGPAAAAPAKYLAPEQIDSSFGPVGPAADLYCLGFTALELLTGPDCDGHFADFPSSEGGIDWRRLHTSRERPMPPAATVVRELPPDLARVIDRLLQKDVAARYASAADALKDLDDVLAPPIPATPSPMTLPPVEAKPARPVNQPTVHIPKAVSTGRAEAAHHETLLPTMFPVLDPPSDRRPLVAPETPWPPRALPPNPPALETVRDTPRYPRWSRRWINQKLENPRVLYPVCGTIVFVTVLLLADLFLNRQATPTPVPPATSQLRAVTIASTPTGAAIEIDGEPLRENTNATIQLKPGRHEVRVALAGYTPLARSIEVPSGGPDPEPFDFRMEPVRTLPPPTTATRPPPTEKPPYVPPPPALGKLRIQSDPDRATVFVDGKNRGRTPVVIEDLTPGKHAVRLELALYRGWQEETDVKSGEESTIRPALEPLRPPGRFALLIGVRSANDGLPVFRHAAGDMAELGRTLLAAGYSAEGLTVLTQVAGGKTDTLPTAERIREAVNALVKDRYPRDTLLLALDGPAVVLPGGGGSYFCPAGADLAKPATLVSLEGIAQQLAACPAATKVVLLDGNRTGPSLPALAEPAKPEDLSLPGVTLLVSTTNGNPGYVHAVTRHGAFWHFVLRGLRGESAGADSEVSVGGLARYVTEKTRVHVEENYKKEQAPKLIAASGTAQSATLARQEPGLLLLRQADVLRERGDQLRTKGEQQRAKDEYVNAGEAYSRAIAARDDLVDAYLGRATVSYQLAQYDRIIDNQLARYDRIIDDCNKVLQLDPVNADAFDLRGDGRRGKAGDLKDMNQGEMELALQDYSKAIELDPDYAPYFNSRGVALGSLSQVYARRKETDKAKAEDELAVADLTRAIDLAPKPRSLYFENRARAYRRLDKLDRAADDYAAALQTGEQLAPNIRFNILYSRGSILYDKQEYALAEADFAKAIELKPDEPNPHLRRADALSKLGRKEEFEKELEKGRELRRRARSNPK